MRRLLVLFFLFIFFAGCQSSNKVPEGIIPQDKMTDVLLDMHLADGYTSSIVDTAKMVAVYQSLYKTYGIDSAKFIKSLTWYSKNPVLLKKMYGVINSRLSSMDKEIKKKEEQRLKEQEEREKKTADSLKKVEKLRMDSIRRDSLKKINLKKAALKKDSLRKDSIKKARLERRLKKETNR